MKNRVLALTGTLAIMLAMATQTQANLILNGSFEYPAVPDDCYQPDPVITSTEAENNGLYGITDWDMVVASYNLIGPNSWQAAVGDQCLELAGANSPGTIAQTFATVAGATYSLFFYYSDNPYPLTYTASITVTDAISESQLFYDTVIGPEGNSSTNMMWQEFSSTFVAKSTSTTLTFKSLETHGAAITIDGVAVELAAIPEPATLALLGIGGMAMLIKRRIARK